MVVPLHAEEEWLPMLSGRPIFEPDKAPIVFVSPHPDDECLSAGGLLAAQCERNLPVTLVAVTDGENAYAGSSGLATRRAQEQLEAAAYLGIALKDIVRLNLPDSGVKAHKEALIQRLAPHVSSATHLLAPWTHDFHPDHEACGDAALELSGRTGARLTFYLFWAWHRGTPALLRNLDLQVFPLSPAQQEAKAKALASHESQLHHASGDPILHDIHLWPARLPFEVYLPA